jgi:hypothetical protein
LVLARVIAAVTKDGIWEKRERERLIKREKEREKREEKYVVVRK